MELKLVAEIKERADQKNRNIRESPLDALQLASSFSADPASQLIFELSETLNLESHSGIASQLKKSVRKSQKEEIGDSGAVIDFKARLRKVDNKKDEEDSSMEIENGVETEQNKRESTASSDSGHIRIDDCDDKRKSSGEFVVFVLL